MSAGAKDRGALWVGLAVTLTVHALFGVVLVLARPDAPPPLPPPEARPILCGQMRCGMLPVSRKRLGPEHLDEPEILEARIVPRLGLAKPRPHRLPKIQKYEQPEKHEVAVNIEKEVKAPKPLPKAPKHKKAQRDRRKRPRKPTSLTALSALDDPDPRARATDLRAIVGVREGSTTGRGVDFKEGDPYAAAVMIAIRRSFRAPQALTDKELRRLRMQVMVSRIADSGAIEAYRVVRKSGNSMFDSAALAAIQRFVPAEGGRARLPRPTAEVRARLGGRGLLIELNGRDL